MAMVVALSLSRGFLPCRRTLATALPPFRAVALQGEDGEDGEQETTEDQWWRSWLYGHGCESHPPAVSLAAWLRRCSTPRLFPLGRVLHARLVEGGIVAGGGGGPDNAASSFVNHLVQMYGRCGRTEEALTLFERAPGHRNLVTWNLAISACALGGGAAAGGGFENKALCLFRRLLEEEEEEGLHPDRCTLLPCLSMCTRVDEVKLVHACAVSNALTPAPVNGSASLETALVHSYGRCGSPRTALSLFESMHAPRNVVSWTAAISACARNGLAEEAARLFQRMQSPEERIKPNKITFLTLFDATTTSSSSSLQNTLVTHAAALANGLENDTAMRNAMINSYGKHSNLARARAVFDLMSRGGQLDVVSWNAMIKAYAQNGLHKEAIELFHLMLDGSVVEPDSITFTCALNAYADLGCLRSGKVMHAQIVLINKRNPPDIVMEAALVNMYSRCGSLGDARKAFDTRQWNDVVLWNAVITAYHQNQHYDEALELFHQMDVKPDKSTYLRVVDACGGSASLETGKAIHKGIDADGLGHDHAIGIALIRMYAKCGSLDDAKAVFNKKHKSSSVLDVTSWNAMIIAYTRNGHSVAGLDMFRQMENAGVKPDKTTFASVIDACANMALLAAGREMHERAVHEGFAPDARLQAALLNMYSKCGSLSDARALFAEMHQPSVVSWTAMISAYTRHGHSAEALKLFRQMERESVKPDGIAFLSILSACGHSGLLEEGRHYFFCMREEEEEEEEGNNYPSVEHYRCMVDLVARTGCSEEAESILNNMPLEAGALPWMGLQGCGERNLF